MRRALVWTICLAACSRTERAPSPDPAPLPAPAKPAVAIDAAVVAAVDPCTPMTATVDDAAVAITGASAVTLHDRSDRATAVQIYVWLAAGSAPPSCEQLRSGGFPSGPRYALITYPLVENVPMAVSARSARQIDAKLDLDRRTEGSVRACVRERVTVSPEWDGATHRLAVAGSITAVDCGTQKL